MGSSAMPEVAVNFRATGVEAVRSGLRLVRAEAQGAGESAEFMAHSTAIAFGELTRGLSRIGQTGEVSAFAIREVTGGVLRLGTALGPAGGLIGITLMLGATFYEIFSKARAEMDKTRENFQQNLAQMLDAGNHAEMMKQALDLQKGTPSQGFKNGIDYLQSHAGGVRSQLASLRAAYPTATGNASGTKLADALGTGAQEDQLQRDLDATMATLTEKQRELKTVSDAILNPNNNPLQTKMLPAMKVTVQSINAEAKEATKAVDAWMTALAKMKPRIAGESIDSSQDSAVDREKTLDALLKKYNPAADHSDIRKAYEQSTKDLFGGLKPKAALLPPDAMADMIKAFLEQVQKPLGTALENGMASTIGSAMSAGITAGFQSHSISGALTGAGKAILAGVGQLIEQEGEVWIKYGVIKTALMAHLANPITSGPAAIAAGALLVATGAAISGIWGGQGGGGYSGSTTSSLPAIVNTGFLDPSNNAATRGAGVAPAKPTTNNVWVIGPNDPKAARQLQEMLDGNMRRG